MILEIVPVLYNIWMKSLYIKELCAATGHIFKKVNVH